MTSPESPQNSPLREIQTRIATAAKIARRKPHDVTLIAISKTHDAEAILPLIAQGQRVFGENRVQEAQSKWPALKAEYPDITLHLVGQLQSNKAEDAVALFDAIHSVDRPSLITALAKAMTKLDRRVPLYVQLPALLAQIREADLPLAGLMCVPPADIEAAPFFALLGKLAQDNALTGLSMGMSSDFETAIMLGATHIRVGSALFGARP
jgi:uncharacterized pyridoxal phosphate-containing UPF0001 family protein